MTVEQSENKAPKFIAVLGPTASGKSSFAFNLAQRLNGELVNCDSVQVYKDFNIGSAKASEAETQQVKHHLLDIITWSDNFDASQYAKLAREAICEISSRGKVPIVVGGTGLYYRSLCGENFHSLPSNKTLREQIEKSSTEWIYKQLMEKDPERAKKLHANDKFRLSRALELFELTGKTQNQNLSIENKNNSFTAAALVLMKPEREILQNKIIERSKNMLQAGLVKEVKSILSRSCPSDAKPMQTIGYKQVVQYLNGSIKNESELLEKIIIATRQYAKKQKCWFQKTKADFLIENEESLMSAQEKIVQQFKN